MEHINISTTQNVSINYQLANVGDRILATILDYLIFIAYFFIVFYIIGTTKANPGFGVSSLIFLPALFYDLYCEVLFNGQSFGKFVLKIKVVKIDGTQPGLGSYLLRWLFRIIESALFFSGLIPLITILINGKGQRLGDIAAKTTVIKLSKKKSLDDGFLNIPDENYEIQFKEVDQLTEKDVAIIREVFNHAKSKGNFAVINQLADKTKRTLNIQTELKSIVFLDTIIKDYEYFHAHSGKW